MQYRNATYKQFNLKEYRTIIRKMYIHLHNPIGETEGSIFDKKNLFPENTIHTIRI